MFQFSLYILKKVYHFFKGGKIAARLQQSTLKFGAHILEHGEYDVLCI